MNNKYDKYKHIESLVVLAKTGDKSAIMELHTLFLPYVKGWFNRVTIPSYTLEDITQEYYFWLLKAITKYSGDSTFTTYLTQTIKNNIFLLIRNHANDSVPTELGELLQDSNCLEDLIMDKVDVQRILNSVLSDLERKVLYNYYFNDLTLYTISSSIKKNYSFTAKLKAKAIKKINNSITRA